MTSLPETLVEKKNGLVLQNLTHPGFSLEGVPNAYQGRRLRFGSCSMAASLTLINGYVNSRHLKVFPVTHPFFKLGTLTPRRRSWIFQIVGEADEAVEANFVECHAQYPASAQGMTECLASKLGSARCLAAHGEAACPTPKVESIDGDLTQRRAFLREHFKRAERAQILPLIFPWDTRVVMGPPQTWEGDVKLEHVSALIGRRLTPRGGCELLIRNSWGTCSHWKQNYAFGTCDSLGQTDDVWVDEESLLKRSAEFTEVRDK
jgi:hypothetical protein